MQTPCLTFIRQIGSFAVVAGCLLGGALAQESVLKPAVKSAEPTAFREVTAQLDAGGSLFVYLSTDQFLGNLSGKVRDVGQFILGMPGMAPGERAQAEQVIGLIQSLVRQSGVEEAAGMGFSGIAIEKGFYRTRFVLQRAGGSDGYLWHWFGSKPHPLAGLDLLPADTVWAGFGDADLLGIWEALLKSGTDAKLAPMVAGMRELSANVEKATGHSLEQHLASYGGEIGIALVLDANRTCNLPLGEIELEELPEPALMLALKVKDDTLFNTVEAALAQNPQSSSGKTETARWRSLTVPVPVTFPFRPTVARLGDYLMVASNDRLVERVDKVRAGKEPGLKSGPEWQRLAKGLPTEGNSFAFVSPRFGQAIEKVQQAVLRQAGEKSGGAAPDFGALQGAFGLSMTPASYSVSWTDATGLHGVGQGTQEPAATLVSSAVVAPTAIMAGMMLPALAKAKSTAQEAACMNNLKQIALGLIMYANDHGDVLPPDLESIKEYLGGAPRMLVCPADSPRAGRASSLTWDDVAKGDTSYEFIKPGIKLDGSDPATTVVCRCRVHGTAAFLDGHVERPKR